jgi:hypothetical protein
MNVEILRDQQEAQKYILQGLWLQRTNDPIPTTVKQILEWTLEIASSGQALPPVGFIADLGHAAFGLDREAKTHKEHIVIPGFPSGLGRTYEDHVLGKIYADWTFERASDAMRRYAVGKERNRGLSYVIKQMRERGQFGGVEMSPGIIRTMLDIQPDELLRRGWDSIQQQGLMPTLIDLYESLIGSARRMAEILALEDVIALEQRTALADMGQYVAHRQVLQIAARFEHGLPKHKVRPLAGRQEVPTRVLDEDTYPVGGFSSISTKGTIESLLHSQLAFMENDPELQPDLFQVKYVRDELYYYSRDENQFLRRRRSFIFVFYPDLVRARFKDAELPCQRIVMLLGLLLTSIRKLSEWLSIDALKFDLIFIREEENKPLGHESHLLEMLLRELIENRTAEIHFLSEKEVETYCTNKARRSLCHCLAMSTEEIEFEVQDTVMTKLELNSSRPSIQTGFQVVFEPEAEDAMEHWIAIIERLLQIWV